VSFQGKIVRQECNNVDAQYERKRKQVEIQKQMSVFLHVILHSLVCFAWFTGFGSEASNQTNKARLRLLQAREQHLEDAFEDARGRLKEITDDKTKYGEVLKNLVLQVRSSFSPSPV
jgi:V-type H+-transporting ATPase subunit E